MRKLAAIVVGDIVGFTRLMRADEARTHERVKQFKSQVVQPALGPHDGRLIKDLGDGFLAVFDSAVNAVGFAISVQRLLAGAHAALELKLRIGVNLGDIIVEETDVYGDGVNVAARLEALCVPGGVCMSATVYDQVRDKIDIVVQDPGPQVVKNVDRPLDVRLWTGGATDTGAPAQTSGDQQRPDRYSIAVLAFVNMSPDPDQDFFADGMSEDIITALSRIQRFAVASRTSSFAYRGRTVDVQQIGRELGVRYVLEGSVRVAGARLRVTTQLIDAATGSHVWAEKFDRMQEDLFDIQDEITRNVVASLQTQIEVFEGQPVPAAERMSLPVWKLVALSVGCVYRMDDASLHHAAAYAEEALKLDPQCGAAALALSNAQLHIAFMTHPDNAQDLIGRALALAEQAVLSSPNDEAYWARGMSWMFSGEARRGISDFERALAINPNNSLAWGCLGAAQALAGQPAAAIGSCEIAIQANPRDPTIFFRYADLGFAYLLLRDFEQAAIWARKSILQNPGYAMAYTVLITALQASGQVTEARASVAECLRTCRHVDHTKSYVALIKRQEDKDFVLDHLKAAGAI